MLLPAEEDENEEWTLWRDKLSHNGLRTYPGFRVGISGANFMLYREDLEGCVRRCLLYFPLMPCTSILALLVALQLPALL